MIVPIDFFFFSFGRVLKSLGKIKSANPIIIFLVQTKTIIRNKEKMEKLTFLRRVSNSLSSDFMRDFTRLRSKIPKQFT